VAEQDLLLTGVPPKIKALQGLSTQRQANVLRHWLRHAHATVPSSAQMHELQRQVAACSTRGHQIHLKIGAGMLQRNETVLHWYNPAVLT
jgi:tRNA(Ile)-lysidine synthase